MGIMMSWSVPMLVSLAVLITSLLALLFSPYRRWVGFMLAGMGYFASLKAVAGGLSSWLGWSLVAGYAASFLLSLLLLSAWLGRQGMRGADSRAVLADPVEHQPIRIQEIN